MDNKLFNVNGRSDDMLLLALKLAAMQNGSRKDAFAGWKYAPDFGLVLYWYAEGGASKEGITPFMHSLTAEEVTPEVLRWLKDSNHAKDEVDKLKVRELSPWPGKSWEPEDPRSTWDLDHDHDGDNSLGWRVYTQGWGHVAGSHYSICAVRPAFMWHGK